MVKNQNKTGYSFIKYCHFFILILFSMLLASNAASADIQQALSCNSGTTIGTGQTTNYSCTGTSYSPLDIGLLNNALPTSGQYIQVNTAGNGPWDYAHLINNTPLTTDSIITAYSTNISMRRGSSTSSRNVYGKYELGYYDPDSRDRGNFTGLFNSTEALTTSSTQNSFPITFNGQSGIIPAGKKLALRVWMRVSGSTDNPRFYSYSNSGTGNSSFYVDISPLTTYSVSGYVTNASNGARISNAIVSVNSTPMQMTSTNGTGYYNFSLSNGTYLITASVTGYSDNSTTRTVNGAAVSNADILLAPLPPATGGKILVATNRYVILDDPIATGKSAQTAEYFSVPPRNDWTSNYWDGFRTQIMGYALLLDENGKPINNTNVIFTLRNWNSSVIETSPNIRTDQYGLANYTFDMNARNYYGRWNITANANGQSNAYGFIYNWFGCQAGGTCSETHGNKNPTSYETPADINSPYTKGAESITGISNHRSVQSDADCVGCHRSYSGVGGNDTFDGQATKTSDVHVTNTCVTCHGNGITHQTNQPIKSCTDTNCHSWANLSQENTMSSGTPPMSNYSGSVAATGHNPNNTIPCIICHGPMHNITKPDETLRFINNNITEDSQCLTCHPSLNKHNSSLGCTVCHSQDIHAIKVLSQSGGYVNKGSTYQGNCTNCHQNATFFATLKQAPKAGAYAGSAPQVQKPLNHSTQSAGTKWGIYWTTQIEACTYCHGDSKHSATGLGIASVAVGTDTVGGPIGTGTVCASCHNSTDNDYGAIMALLIPNPVAFKPGFNWNVTGIDHASYGTTDADCKSCHGGVLSGPSATISEFVHNVDKGKGGGPDCVSCHDIGASQAKVDVSKMNTSTSIHNTLNSDATVTRADNKRCYACHTNSTLSSDNVVNQAELSTSGHPDKYNIPKKCMDCHEKGNFSALIVKEHNSAGSDIKTKPYTNTNDSCVNCHNKSEMIIANNDPAGPKSEFARVSHYGSNKTGVSPYNTGGASNCTYCHQGSSAFSTEMVNPTWNTSIDNHTELGTNPGCTNANCHNSGRIHESTLTKPTLVLPNSSYCQICHISVQKHNGSVNCTECHLSTNKNIHPVQYLQPTGTFLINSIPNKASSVNCTSCHQGTLTGFNSAPQVKTPLSHSNDNGGQKWGNYWTSQKDACLYCHGNSKHNTSGFGKALTAMGSDPIGGAIGSGTLCASCHNSADSDYNAIMNLLITYPVANVPGSNYNLSGTNHASYGTTDADCLPCHGSALSPSPTISEFPHNVATATGCTACHGQPPNGLTRNNTDGAHTIHKNAGYGNVPQTGCNYCHSNGGINDGGVHPNKIYNVTFNASVSSISYAQNPATGSDDTCAGVSCHTNGLSAGAKNGIAIWNSSTAGRCDVCHSTSPSGLPATGNHSKHYMTRGYPCSTCHGTGADAGTQSGHKTNALIDMNFTGTLATGGSINATRSCTVYCHSPNNNDPKPKPTWGTTLGACGTNCHSKPPAITKTGSTVHAGLTGSSDCEGCHGVGANNGTQAGHVNGAIDGSGASCTGCHSNVNSTILGLHSNLSGTPAVEDSDCKTCHFGTFSMVTGAANSSNTLYCQACHTSAGNGSVKPTNPTLIKDGLSHGSADCKWCHAADNQPDYRYHLSGRPLGTAAGKNCGSCHLSSNLPDRPFHAPGISHSVTDTSGQSCGPPDGCHQQADNHQVEYKSSSFRPSISGLSIITTPVKAGDPAQVQATVTDSFLQIAAAQYRVTTLSGSVVINWTNMTPQDGGFNYYREIVIADIDTSILTPGIYTVNVQGMASAPRVSDPPRTDPSKPYYPLNGRWSFVQSTSLDVTQPTGYVNGTIKNNSGSIISGATITTNTGVSTISDMNGFYSLNLVFGTYQLTASKDPEYYPINGVNVMTGATPATQNFNLNKKPTGTISGIVRMI